MICTYCGWKLPSPCTRLDRMDPNVPTRRRGVPAQMWSFHIRAERPYTFPCCRSDLGGTGTDLLMQRRDDLSSATRASTPLLLLVCRYNDATIVPFVPAAGDAQLTLACHL
eukprot:671901-Pyramimonas_sp.AAC.1